MSNRIREPIQLPYVLEYNNDDRYNEWSTSYLNHRYLGDQTVYGFSTRKEAARYAAKMSRLGWYRVTYRPEYDISAPIEIGI